MRVFCWVAPVAILVMVRVLLEVKPGEPVLGTQSSPAGKVTVLGFVGAVRIPVVDSTVT